MDDKPPEKPTVELDKSEIVAGLLKKLTDQVTEGFSGTHTRLDRVEKNGEEMNRRLIVVEEWRKDADARQDQLEARQGNNSLIVKKESSSNLDQDAAIAAIKVDLAAVKGETESQTAILKRLDAIAANPMVRRVAYAIGFALLAWLTAKGLVPK